MPAAIRRWPMRWNSCAEAAAPAPCATAVSRVGITRHYAQPDQGVHALQMELACRGYMQEPEQITPDTWPTPWQPVHAAALRAVLRHVLRACLDFAAGATPAAHR